MSGTKEIIHNRPQLPEWRDITISKQPDGFYTVALVGGDKADNLCWDEIFCAVNCAIVRGDPHYRTSGVSQKQR